MSWPDHSVEVWVTAHRTQHLVDTAKLVTLLGDSIFVGTVAVVVGAVLSWRFHAGGRPRAWEPLAASVGGWIAVEAVARVLKVVVGRARPPFQDAVVHLANASLPAAHVARATYALAVLALVAPRPWLKPYAAVAVVAVVAVGWSRVELGTHWLTDALVAWPLGLLAVWPLYRVTGRVPSRRALVAGGRP